MKIERYKNNWYLAQHTFTTKYGTIATASGHGATFALAIVECLKDYKIIISL